MDFIREVAQAAINGYWLTVSDILWHSYNHREAYYAYKESCWKSVTNAKTFSGWIRNGGWKLRN